MRKPCNECPFLKATPLIGAPDWLKDILKFGRENPFFEHSCHKTDPLADGFAGAKEKRGCAGHLTMLVNEIDGTPGQGGVYRSRDELIETYLVHWLGREQFEEIRKAVQRKGAKHADRPLLKMPAVAHRQEVQAPAHGLKLHQKVSRLFAANEGGSSGAIESFRGGESERATDLI
jgi:Arc/MetJ-type ribon-helix-helix transcriptional regulator